MNERSRINRVQAVGAYPPPENGEVLTYEDLRVVYHAMRAYRAGRLQHAKTHGYEPKGIDQMRRIERIVELLADAKKGAHA